MLRFENGFEIRDLHHCASKKVPHTILQILMVTEIQLFRKFQIFADRGPRRKTEKFGQIEKKIIDLYELDNSKK